MHLFRRTLNLVRGLVSRWLGHSLPAPPHPPQSPIAFNWAPGPTNMRAAAHGGLGWQGIGLKREGKLLASHTGMNGQSGLPLGWPVVSFLTTAAAAVSRPPLAGVPH